MAGEVSEVWGCCLARLFLTRGCCGGTAVSVDAAARAAEDFLGPNARDEHSSERSLVVHEPRLNRICFAEGKCPCVDPLPASSLSVSSVSPYVGRRRRVGRGRRTQRQWEREQ